MLQDFVQGRAAKGLAGRPSTPDKYRFQTPPENPGRRFLPPPPSGHLFCLEMPERLLYNRWDSRPCLKIGEMANGERFFRQSRRFDAGIFVYGKENQRRMAKKDPPLGCFDMFQTRPSVFTGGKNMRTCKSFSKGVYC